MESESSNTGARSRQLDGWQHSSSQPFTLCFEGTLTPNRAGISHPLVKQTPPDNDSGYARLLFSIQQLIPKWMRCSSLRHQARMQFRQPALIASFAAHLQIWHYMKVRALSNS